VRLYARIALLLGGFLLVAGLVYGLTAYEWRGFVQLLIAGGGFAFVGLYVWRVVRSADRAAAAAEPAVQAPVSVESKEAAAEVPEDAGAHVEEVRPTIWPLVFSLAGAGLVVGLLASHWILLVGGLLAVAAAAGWFREVLVQRQQHH
jgi:hypothetical protein